MKKREITNHDIEQLFNHLVEQQPIINEEQVNSLLYSFPKAPSGNPAKHFFKTHLNLIVMSTLVSSIIIGSVLWMNATKSKNPDIKIYKEQKSSISQSEIQTITKYKIIQKKTKKPIEDSNSSNNDSTKQFTQPENPIKKVSPKDDTAKLTQITKSQISAIESAISNALVLSNNDLTKLGFVFTNNGFEYRNQIPNTELFQVTTPTYLRFFFKSDGGYGVSVLHKDELGKIVDTLIRFGNYQFFPEIVSDKIGHSPLSYGLRRSEKVIKNKAGTQLDTITSTINQEVGGSYRKLKDLTNFLIPIMVKLNPNQPDEKDWYFWFTPTDALFDALPDSIGSVLRNDYKIIQLKRNPEISNEVKSQLTTSCKYFEECRATLFDVAFNVWPNPTGGDINVELQLQNPDNLSITMYSITGTRMFTLKPQTYFPAGNHPFNFSLSSLKPGIYLISIQNEKGQFKTQRIIKQ